ncbi:MAG: hypothetical protein JO022_08095 [Acidobacteriaceae bacterium]|nr:hypothetical protein [Acidobacteriaceae bacterium]
MNDTVLYAFIIVAMIVIIVQGAALVAMFLGLRKTSAKVEALTDQVQNRALPILETAKELMDDIGPKISSISANMEEVSDTVRGQVQRVDGVMSELVDRTRLQAIRVDELVSRTIDRVEETTELVQDTVITPVKQMSGIMQGISVGIASLIARRRKAAADAMSSADEEMFI